MCGEQRLCANMDGAIRGSPPRVRGTVSKQANNLPAVRITPACAGNSAAEGVGEGAELDHPRVCGEQCFAVIPGPVRIGSPPRVRGTALPRRHYSFELRITPACAGNSSGAICRRNFYRDHPRVCGEQAVAVPFSREPPGSPPRVRGTGFGSTGR